MKSISNSFFKGIKNDKRETGIENKKAVENRKWFRFPVRLKKEELEALVACIRDRIDHLGE